MLSLRPPGPRLPFPCRLCFCFDDAPAGSLGSASWERGGAVIRDSSCPSPLEFRCPVPFFLPPEYFGLRTSSLGQSILKISEGASASPGFRVQCTFHNQLLCDVTTCRVVQTERVAELERCRAILENKRRPLKLEHGEQRKRSA